MVDTEVVMRARNLTLLAVLLISGCGGGGSDLPPAGGSTVTAGNLQLTGTLDPVSFTSGIGANVYALTGSITKATMTDPNPTLDETEIFTSMTSNIGDELVAMSPSGSNQRVVATGVNANFLAVSTTYVYYLQSATSTLYRVPYGGGTATTLKTGVLSFALSPDGSKLLYITAVSELRYCNADGTGDNLITSPGPRIVMGFLSSTKGLIFDGSGNLYSAALSPGGSIVGIGSYAGLSVAGTQANAHKVAWYDGASLHSSIFTPTGSMSDLTTPIASTFLRSIGYAPDGSAFALARSGTIDLLELWYPDLTPGSVLGRDYFYHSVAWGPFMASRQFLPSGTFATAGAAILFSETSSRVPSVVIADATTRTTMAATRVSVDGAVNITYRLDCDQLTKLFYSKGANYALNQVVNSISGLKGAFVSFDATTGLLSSVVTFTKRPTVSHRSGSLVIEGDGLTLHDLKASKRAVQPSGTIVIAE